ncbi:hypothetical protein Pelo_4101 [Pelomyxa schiedti]|nr:hypothetical protein Pelo_4101 [Pelomyxa schiedti]
MASKESEKQRILRLSRVVWDQVIVPWILRPARAARCWNQPLDPGAVACLLRTGEAVFPLLGLCCRAAAPSHRDRSQLVSGHYRSLEDAAAALCPKCIAWIVASKARDRRAAEGDDVVVAAVQGGERERERERIRAKEKVAVLTGLCCGGHLDAARAFVGTNCERWVGVGVGVEEGPSDEVPLLWASSPLGDTDVETRRERETGTVVPPSVLYCKSAFSLENEPFLLEEFWSARGVFKLTEEVCAKGHLDVLKWILSSFFHIDQSNKIMLIPFLFEASRSGHIDILKWLVYTFDLMIFFDSNLAAAYFQATNSVHDLKRFVESFPDWQPFFDGVKLAKSAGLFQGPSTDEIIEVCQWLKDHFSLRRLDFINWDELSKLNTEVLKWALSDPTTSTELSEAWNLSCYELSDVELAKWFIEEKGIAPDYCNFADACGSASDNLTFVEWLSKQVPTGSEELLMALKTALACQNYSISKWLEQRFIETTGARPKLSLMDLTEFPRKPHEDWLDWLFTHSSSCDIDHSETELAKLMAQSGHCSSPFQLHVAVSTWKKFSLLSPITHHNLLLDLLGEVLPFGSLSQVKEVFSLGQFSHTEMQWFLDHYRLKSSKVGKWLVRECTKLCFSDPLAAVTVKNFPSACRLFVDSIRINKRGFTKWLFNTFHVTLKEVLFELCRDQAPLRGVDLATWKLLLRLFPSEINWELLITNPHLLAIARATPLHVALTIERVPGVTVGDITSVLPWYQ